MIWLIMQNSFIGFYLELRKLLEYGTIVTNNSRITPLMDFFHSLKNYNLLSQFLKNWKHFKEGCNFTMGTRPII